MLKSNLFFSLAAKRCLVNTGAQFRRLCQAIAQCVAGRLLRRAGAVMAALLAAQLAFAQTPLPKESDRLTAAAKLWITVKYFHPYLASRDIDWDKALVDALPKIRAAATSAEYVAAVQSMLDPLHDPVSYSFVEPATDGAAPTSFKYSLQPDGTLVVSNSGTATGQTELQHLSDELNHASNVIFDLRGNGLLSYALDQAKIRNSLTRVPLDIPGERSWVHQGLPPHNGFGSGSYHSAFYTKPGSRIDSRIEGMPAAPERKIAFIVGEHPRVPIIANALAGAGKAVVVTTSPHYQIGGVNTTTIVMGGNVNATVRLSEAIFPNGQGLPAIPAVAEKDALNVLKHPPAMQSGRTLPVYPTAKADLAYSNQPYPSTEYRILAADKIWGVFKYFFAYRDQMDEDWDQVFADFLPKFIAAKDAREYDLTIAEMVSHINDSHAVVSSKTLTEYFGEAPVPLQLRLIERKPVVTRILNDEAKAAGVKIGDIVTKVDGEDIRIRFERERKYVSASTAQSLGYILMRRILNGPDGSLATLTIKSEDGEPREVKLKRSKSYLPEMRNQRTGDIVKLLPGNIGYADLDRLKPDQVDAMFEKFRNTKGIIFDMRGYPYGTAWSIAPRLTDKQDVPAAIFTGPVAFVPDNQENGITNQTASYFFVQTLPRTTKWRYHEKTVMLIDERTMSQAEHTGLFFEAANRTVFIGSPTAGANGDVTNFVVPGGVTINFSGHDVRHVNGGELQRLGIQPTVAVSPTIEGIRTGKDEVLQKAIEYLSDADDSRRLAALNLSPKPAGH